MENSLGNHGKINILPHFLTLFTCLVWFRPRSPQISQISVDSSSFFLCFREVILVCFWLPKQVAKIGTPPYQFDRAAPEHCTVEQSCFVCS
jgi:hypothetical protein